MPATLNQFAQGFVASLKVKVQAWRLVNADEGLVGGHLHDLQHEGMATLPFRRSNCSLET